MKHLACLALLFIFLPMLSLANDDTHGEEHAENFQVEMLSNDLRILLSKEMLASEAGMMSIIPAYVAGEWNDIQTTAEKMKSSYILKQSLTESQKKELHSVLPKEFIAKDQRFHYLAGMLEHAAKNRKSELVNFYFSEMTESCAACHAVFAKHRFPAFAPKSDEEHSH